MARVDVRTAVLEALRARSGAARFVREVHAALGLPEIEGADLERALGELEADGAVIVRDHPCADPHLAGTDLRIVALVEADSGGDAQRQAIEAIDQTWQQWLGEYLASHRCS